MLPGLLEFKHLLVNYWIAQSYPHAYSKYPTLFTAVECLMHRKNDLLTLLILYLFLYPVFSIIY